MEEGKASDEFFSPTYTGLAERAHLARPAIDLSTRIGGAGYDPEWPRRQDTVVTIRRRLPADDDAIRRLNDVAFGGPAEAKLIGEARTSGLAAIELVALEATDVVGHIVFSKLDVTSDGQPIDVLARRWQCGRTGSELASAAPWSTPGSVRRAAANGVQRSCSAIHPTIHASDSRRSAPGTSRRRSAAMPSWRWNSRPAHSPALK